MAISTPNPTPPTPKSHFRNIQITPSAPAFDLADEYHADPSTTKVSLGAGVYRDNEGKPWRLPVVAAAQAQIELDPATDHEYQPIRGHPQFLDRARDVVFGPQDGKSSRNSNNICSVQTISGSGANSLGARFISKNLRPRNVWISDPSWDNHTLIWSVVKEDVEVREYPYYDARTKSFDIDGMLDILEREAREDDVLLLHACAHNPTGIDPSWEEWERIKEICVRKKLFPFFDSAYQGFASGSLEKDSFSIRHFLNTTNLEFIVAQSFSKNFGLYGQRVGALHLVTSNHDAAKRALSGLTTLVRAEYSVAPVYGARIVALVLSDEKMRRMWQRDLDTMSGRLKTMRRELRDGLVSRGTPGSWEHIINQTGMFSYTGLNKSQIITLKRDWHIYVMDTGRISIAGLNTSNIDYVCDAIDSVVRNESR